MHACAQGLVVRELHSVFEVVLPDDRVRVVPKAGSVLRVGRFGIFDGHALVGRNS